MYQKKKKPSHEYISLDTFQLLHHHLSLLGFTLLRSTMATPRFLHLSRRLTAVTTTAKSSLSTVAAPAPQFSLLRALSAVRLPITAVLPSSSPRMFSTQIVTPLLDLWHPPCPEEKYLPDGCDFEHWLIVFYPPPEYWSRDQIIDFYVKTLAQVVGSEEEARKRIYSVSTKHYFAFGALMDEETSAKFKEIEKVEWVLPDSYFDDKTKDYGGEPFINGQAVPYDPKYHAEWVRNNQRELAKSKSEEHSVTANEPGGSPNSAVDGQNPGNADCQQNVPPNNAGVQQIMSLNNAGHGQNIPPNNMNDNVYGNNTGPNYQAGEEMPNHAPNGGYQGRNVPVRDLPYRLYIKGESKNLVYIKGASFRLLSWDP
ncbi:uncharacterized protein LOC141647010 [Silene latifolia]|uniref:uncharacterized protein LOC141647010 n=1 Tax=Silene latifolia TaxID=37657 RepID=UPI003D76F25B